MARIASFRRHLVPSILVAVLLGLGASFVAVGAAVTDQSGDSTAKDTQDPTGNYTFTLPVGWKDDGGGRFTDPAHGTELVITVKKDNGRNLDDEMNDDKTSDKGKGGYRGGQVGDQDLMLGGQSAKGTHFYSDSGDVDQDSTVAVIAIYKGNVYRLRFRGGQNQEKVTGPTIVAILNSWQFH